MLWVPGLQNENTSLYQLLLLLLTDLCFSTLSVVDDLTENGFLHSTNEILIQTLNLQLQWCNYQGKDALWSFHKCV